MDIINIDNPSDHIIITQITAIPEIKATNVAQKIGGTVTYNERYLTMMAFKISDNSLDFDTTENTKKTAKPKATPKKTVVKKVIAKIDDENFKIAENWCKTNKKSITDAKAYFEVTGDVEVELTKRIK